METTMSSDLLQEIKKCINRIFEMTLQMIYTSLPSSYYFQSSNFTLLKEEM
jgi:hypothetical protein